MKKLVFLIAMLSVASTAWATSCTRGFDCYCDRVRTNASVNGLPNIFDSSLLICEDWEAPTLHENVNVGGGAPNWGPSYDTPAGSGNRGLNNFMTHEWTEAGAGVGGCLFSYHEPSLTPNFGPTCDFAGPGSQCIEVKIWHPTNLWQANAFRPCQTILRNGEFGAEVAANGPPTGAAGGGSGVFDGTQSYAHRISQGASNGNEGGIEGSKSFHGARRTFGVTMAVAFPTTLVQSEILSDRNTGGQNWKFNEWHPTQAGAGGDGLFGFGYANTMNTYFPFYVFMFTGQAGQAFATACQNSANAATKTVGRIVCNDVQLEIHGDTNSQYSRPVDWPAATWGCMRGTYTNMGLANASIKIQFTPSAGPHAGTEMTVIDVSNLNMATPPGFQSQAAGYDYFILDGFYNGNTSSANGNPTGNFGTTVAMFRYEDNLHIRAGAPVSCAQIGFGVTAPTQPNPPTNLHFVSVIFGLLGLAALIGAKTYWGVAA